MVPPWLGNFHMVIIEFSSVFFVNIFHYYGIIYIYTPIIRLRVIPFMIVEGFNPHE